MAMVAQIKGYDRLGYHGAIEHRAAFALVVHAACHQRRLRGVEAEMAPQAMVIKSVGMMGSEWASIWKLWKVVISGTSYFPNTITPAAPEP